MIVFFILICYISQVPGEFTANKKIVCPRDYDWRITHQCWYTLHVFANLSFLPFPLSSMRHHFNWDMNCETICENTNYEDMFFLRKWSVTVHINTTGRNLIIFFNQHVRKESFEVFHFYSQENFQTKYLHRPQSYFDFISFENLCTLKEIWNTKLNSTMELCQHFIYVSTKYSQSSENTDTHTRY